MTTTAQIIEKLKACEGDPMWSDHAEISKKTLREAIAALEHDQARQEIDDAIRINWLEAWRQAGNQNGRGLTSYSFDSTDGSKDVRAQIDEHIQSCVESGTGTKEKYQ